MRVSTDSREREGNNVNLLIAPFKCSFNPDLRGITFVNNNNPFKT